MRKYKEVKAKDLKEGSIVVKHHGYAEKVESIIDVTENVKLISFSDSADNVHEIYVRNDQKYNVRTDELNEKKSGKDHEFSMARSQLSTIKGATERLMKKVKGEGQLEAWVQSKITKAADYIDTAADYMESDESKEVNEGKLYDRLVSQLMAKGMPEDKAHATATSQLQKHGSLKPGTRELTKHGKKREKMGAAGRAKDRAAKKSGKKPSDYKYNAKTNGATLKDSFDPEGDLILEKNTPTNPSLWSRAKALAKSKFKVYPSAYANGWAAKWYKKRGGGWKKG